MTPEKSSTRIRRMPAGSTFLWARTTFSISLRKDATKMALPTPWPGFGITIATTRAISLMRRRSTRHRKARELHAATRSTTNERARLLRRGWGNVESPLRSHNRSTNIGSADRARRTAPTDAYAARSRPRPLGRSWQPAGAVAQVPGLSRRLLRDHQRGRDLRVHRGVHSARAGDALCSVAGLLCSKPRGAFAQNPANSKK